MRSTVFLEKVIDTNVLGDLFLCHAHKIGGIGNAIVEDVVLYFLADTNLQRLGLRRVPRPTPTTCTTPIASSVSSSSSKPGLSHPYDLGNLLK
jgi:hypothetical protein